MSHFNKVLHSLPQMPQIGTDEFAIYLINLFNTSNLRQKSFL
jgi:hypothetical protein